MQTILIFMSSALATASYFVYIAAILKGKAKPHRTTRFVLVIITTLATVALFAQGNSTAIWLPGIFTLGSLIIFVLSLKFGMGGYGKTDLICLGLSIAGIVFWKITNNPIYALFLSILADFVGQIPMLIKTYRFPKTEVWTFYVLDILAALLNLLALRSWIIQEYAYPIYIALIDCFITFLILRPKLKVFNKQFTF